MNTHTPDFVTVDMRGLKADLIARAQAQQVSISVLQCAAVARDLGVDGVSETDQTGNPVCTSGRPAHVKLSSRMTTDEAERLSSAARAADLSRGAFLAGLMADIPVPTTGANRTDHLKALSASCAEHTRATGW